MAADEGVQAGGSGAGRDKKRPAGGSPGPGSPGPGSNGRSAPPKAAPARAAAAGPRATPSQPARKASAADSEDLVVVTLRASTGSIVSVEMTAPDGSRHALTDSETARLVGERPTFASLVHDAFEAGIACVLDHGAGDEASGESQEDVDLHDALLDALIERSTAKRLLSREMLTSAVLGTIIREASGRAAPRHA